MKWYGYLPSCLALCVRLVSVSVLSGLKYNSGCGSNRKLLSFTVLWFNA